MSTAVAAIVNAGSSTAVECSIAPGAAQTFLIAFTPAATFTGIAVQFRFGCANTEPAPVIAGVNTFRLFSESGPAPDAIGVAATATYDGVPGVSGPVGAFAVAILNLGADQFRAVGLIRSEVAVDAGGVALPVSVSVCPADLVSGNSSPSRMT